MAGRTAPRRSASRPAKGPTMPPITWPGKQQRCVDRCQVPDALQVHQQQEQNREVGEALQNEHPSSDEHGGGADRDFDPEDPAPLRRAQ